MAALMFVVVATSSASAQTQELPNAITWLAPSGTSASDQGLENYYNGTFHGSRRYSMPASYAPDGMYLPPPRVVWDDTLGYWDNSQVVDIGGYYTDDTNSSMWWSPEDYYNAHPEAISPAGEILQPATYHPNLAINPVWISTPGYRSIPNEIPRQYYASESVDLYIAVGDSMVAIQRTLTILEKMPSGDDAQVSSTTTQEAAYLDWATGSFSTGEFQASFPTASEDPVIQDPGEGNDTNTHLYPHMFVLDTSIFPNDIEAGCKFISVVSFNYNHDSDTVENLYTYKQIGSTNVPIGLEDSVEIASIDVPGGGQADINFDFLGAGYVGIHFVGDIYTKMLPMNWMVPIQPFEWHIKWSIDLTANVDQPVSSGTINGYHFAYPTFTITSEKGLLYQSQQTSLLSLASLRWSETPLLMNAVSIPGVTF